MGPREGQAGHKKRTARRQSRALCLLVAIATFLLLVSWWVNVTNLPIIGSSGNNRPKGDMRVNQQPIPTTIQKSSSRCNTFSNIPNVTRFRFYPKRFFEQGPGRPFLPNLLYNRDNFTDILNARFLVFLDGDCSIVHYHIHKNGGTTLERHVPLSTDNYYSKREKELGTEQFELASASIMKGVHDKQQQEQKSAVQTFTFLRDPVSRFLSSVAQVLKLRVWHKRLHPCYERNSTEELLDCVLDKLETGNIPEMHLSPQSYELYKQVMGYDIYIDLMDLSEIGTVLQSLGAMNVPPKERATTGTIIRRFPKFRIDMNALNNDRIRRICQVYAADVLMLQEAGITKTKCTLP